MIHGTETDWRSLSYDVTKQEQATLSPPRSDPANVGRQNTAINRAPFVYVREEVERRFQSKRNAFFF